MDEKDKQFIEKLFIKQTEQFQLYVGAIAENFDHKLVLVSEGHSMLAEKMDRIEMRIDRVETRIDQVEAGLGAKIDRVAADVAAHRADTEAHHGIYRVKES